MAPFTGQANVNVDAKLRLAIPSKFRAVAERSVRGGTSPGPRADAPSETTASDYEERLAWYCVPSPRSGLLKLYLEDTFTRLASQRDSSLSPDDPDQDARETALFGSAERLETDSAGRVKLQRWHLDMIDLPSEVTVVGRNDHLRVYGREAWAEMLKQHQEMLP